VIALICYGAWAVFCVLAALLATAHGIVTVMIVMGMIASAWLYVHETRRKGREGRRHHEPRS
jgi:ABC-type xylose transport system permease subunit